MKERKKGIKQLACDVSTGSSFSSYKSKLKARNQKEGEDHSNGSRNQL